MSIYSEAGPLNTLIHCLFILDKIRINLLMFPQPTDFSTYKLNKVLLEVAPHWQHDRNTLKKKKKDTHTPHTHK